MIRPTRQCLSRWPVRLLLLATIALAIFWAFLSGSNTEYPCSSSKQCYEILVNKARQMGSSAVMEGAARRQRQAASFMAVVADRFSDKLQTHARESEPAIATATTTNTAAAATTASEEEQAQIQKPYLTPEEAEYARLTDASQERVKAAFVVLARNQEIYSLRSSMRHLEDRFNHKYNYPWIFLNEQPFTDEFKNLTRQMTNAEVYYGLVPKEHWSYPEWINQTYAAQCRQDMANLGVVYGGSESYRHMCRYQSGFFMFHPLLDGLEYYWRVEPGVSFSCDIDYDPFRLMKERDLKYGFTIALQELYYTIPTLWDKTVEYTKLYPQYIYDKAQPDSLFGMVTNDNGWTYNLCHFWSNFEIASVSFMRSEAYQSYFRFLDQAGGFFYERWGDAPVHSIAVALMLREKDVHWFYDIGYKHDFFEHCPTEPGWLVHGKCYCDPNTSFDYTEGSCMSRFLQVTNRTATSYLVTMPDKVD